MDLPRGLGLESKPETLKMEVSMGPYFLCGYLLELGFQMNPSYQEPLDWTAMEYQHWKLMVSGRFCSKVLATSVGLKDALPT